MECDVLYAMVGDVRQDSRGLRQLRALGERGWQVVTLTFGAPPPAGDDPVLPDSVHLRTLERPPGSGPLFFWRAHRLFRQAARQVSASLYHAADLYVLPALTGATRQHEGSLAYDARELYPHVGATAGKPWARWFWQALERYYIRQADCVLTVSKSIGRYLADRYDIERPLFVPNVPPHREVKSSNDLREHVGLSVSCPLLLYQGAFKPGRGCGLLISAMRHVHDAALVLLGDGPLEDDLRVQAQRLGVADRVHFHPRVPPDDLLRYTASADVGVALIEERSLSLYFSLPNKLFQYLMAGVPVIASDFPEMRRVVAEHKVGAVVDPDDAQAVAQTLRRAVHDAETREQWAGNIETIWETFSWKKASQTMCNTYESLLAEHA